MAITTYAELQTAISNRLGRRTDLTSYLPDYITLGEARIYRELRVRQMETSFSTAISSGVIALPTSYRALKFAYVNGTTAKKLQRKDAEWIYTNYPTRSADGEPRFIAQEASNFIFGPYPDDTYTIKGVYYKALAALSTGVNWLLTDAPDLILYASLAEAGDDLQDDRAAMWAAKYEQAKQAVQLESDKEEFSGSVLSMTAG
jgi:hypothetical protein